MAQAVFKPTDAGTVTLFYEHTRQQAAQQDPWKNTGAVRDDVRVHNANADETIEWVQTDFWGR
jgi:hypothetical protein